MNETVHTFGATGSMVGILTRPEAPTAKPLLLMSNVGLNHRVGPYRGWVELAREVAAAGFPSLRYDVSGLGDSPPRQETLDDIERAVLDFGDAVTYASTLGYNRIISVSNCSGTDNAHRGALTHPQVVGAIFIDGYSYRPSHPMRRKLGAVLSARAWQRYFRREYPQLFGLPKHVAAVGATDEIYKRSYPEPEAWGNDLATLVQRGTKLLMVYSGETSNCYADQLYDTVPQAKTWGNAIRVAYIPEANHTFRYRASRQKLHQVLMGWLAASF